MSVQPAPLYTRSYALCLEVFRRTQRFPRPLRAVIGVRLESSGMDLVESVSAALTNVECRDLEQHRADAALVRLRVALRLARDLGALPPGLADSFIVEADALGKMLGGWRRHTRPSHADGLR
jgi:hypothetical protein